MAKLYFLIFQVFIVRAFATPSAIDYWRQHLPNIPLPSPLEKAASNLSDAQLSNYISQVKSGQLISVSNFCATAQLYCDFTPFSPADLCLRIRFRYKLYIYISFLRCANDVSSPPTFFHEKSLFAATLNVSDLRDPFPTRAILPKSLGDTFPRLSPVNLSQYLKLFNTTSNTSTGAAISVSLSLCNDSSGSCVSSLEDLVSLALPYTNLSYNSAAVGALVNVRILRVSIVPVTEKIQACHLFVFPYQLFYCHTFSSRETVLYKVDLVNISSLFVVCHRNTTDWDPSHVAFKELNSLPGKTDACHFVSQNEMVWY